ncbi:MAG: hypothetical protein U0R78_05320 [Nocardioidaceae bacterium]
MSRRHLQRNPLAMAAAWAMLTEVATDEAYAHIERLAGRRRAGIEEIISTRDLPWHVVTAGAKGCIAFRAERIRNYRDLLGVDERLGEYRLVQHNGQVFLPPWGKIEGGSCPSSTPTRTSTASSATSPPPTRWPPVERTPVEVRGGEDGRRAPSSTTTSASLGAARQEGTPVTTPLAIAGGAVSLRGLVRSFDGVRAVDWARHRGGRVLRSSGSRAAARPRCWCG